MDDLTLWNFGMAELKKVSIGLPPSESQRLSELLNEYRCIKEAMSLVTRNIGSENICCQCAGQCCMNGKYRINVFDLLSLCFSDVSMLPDFDRLPLCPYSGDIGCQMQPGFRPAGCVQFLCEIIDGQLTDSARKTLSSGEKTLRGILVNASDLLAFRVTTPLLLWAEQNHNFKLNEAL